MMRGKSQVIALLYFILLFHKCGTKNVSYKMIYFISLELSVTHLLPSPQVDYTQTLPPRRLPFPESV